MVLLHLTPWAAFICFPPRWPLTSPDSWLSSPIETAYGTIRIRFLFSPTHRQSQQSGSSSTDSLYLKPSWSFLLFPCVWWGWDISAVNIFSRLQQTNEHLGRDQSSGLSYPQTSLSSSDLSSSGDKNWPCFSFCAASWNNIMNINDERFIFHLKLDEWSPASIPPSTIPRTSRRIFHINRLRLKVNPATSDMPTSGSDKGELTRNQLASHGSADLHRPIRSLYWLICFEQSETRSHQPQLCRWALNVTSNSSSDDPFTSFHTSSWSTLQTDQRAKLAPSGAERSGK